MDKLIGFGASSVEGVGDSLGGFLRRLEAKLAQAGKPHEYLNYGIGGNTTRDMLARLDAVRPHLPSRAIVQLGSNDLPRERDENPAARTTLPEFSQNAETILRAFAGQKTIFVSSFAIDPVRTGIRSEAFAQYMKEAMEIAQSLHLTTLDFYAESLDFGDKYLTEDGLHYNDAGHEIIAARLFSLISKQD